MSLTPFAMDPASSASRLSVSTLIFLPDSQETPKIRITARAQVISS